EAHRMELRQLGKSFQIAGGAPHFVTLGDEQLRNGQTNAGARTGEKDMFHQARLLDRRWCNHPTPKIARNTRPAVNWPAIPDKNRRQGSAGIKATMAVRTGGWMLRHGFCHPKTRRRTKKRRTPCTT